MFVGFDVYVTQNSTDSNKYCLMNHRGDINRRLFFLLETIV